MDKFISIINKIRDILRKDGITDMDSINHCIAFYMCRKLNIDLCHRLGISQVYSFENIQLHSDMKKLDDGELMERFFVKGKKDCFVNEVLVTKFKFDQIRQFSLKNPIYLQEIFTQLKKINIDDNLDYDAIGIIYETHLSTGKGKGMRDLGQFFTNRKVINYMVELCNPIVIDGKIETILDPTMGTGGFLASAVKYLERNNDINWNKNSKRICGFDISESVKSLAYVNLFLETGEEFKRIIQQDTLRNDLLTNEGIIDKVDVILANEPFGIKGLKWEDCCDKIKKLKIKGTKAEPMFLQLMMKSLNDGGRCAVIVPDGVLFNDAKQHKSTREYLLKNFNLKKVISMEGDFFMNTGVKTSILFFENSGSTEQVEFCKIQLVDDKIVENVIISVDIDDIKDYSLQVGIYLKEEVEQIEGIEYKKLGDICELKIGGTPKRNIEEYWKNGTNLWLSISEMNDNIIYDTKEKITDIGVEKSNVKLVKKGSILMSFKMSLGKRSIAGTDLYTNEAIVSINSKVPYVLNKYIYHYIPYFDFSNACSSIANGNMNTKSLGEIMIPIPSISKQEKIIEILDNQENIISANKKLIEMYEKKKQHIIYANTLNCEKKNLDELCEFNKTTTEKIFDIIEYIDIGSVEKGFLLSTNTLKIKDAPSRAKRSVQINDILLSTVRPNLENYLFISSNIYKKNLIASTGFCVISPNINPLYCYYIISSNEITQYLTKNATGASYPAINLDVIKKIKIPIINIDLQEKVANECSKLDNIINLLKQEISSINILNMDNLV